MNKDNVLVLGDGFLGSCFGRNGFPISGRSLHQFPRDDLNGRFEKYMIRHNVKVLINTIGVSDTRFCEKPENWGLVKYVNGELPAYLSKVCNGEGIKYIHVSTGCLYSNKNGECTEETFTSANCRYAMSKWIGECGCDPDRDLIIRPRLLFDSVKAPTGKRNNLIQKFSMFSEYLNEFNTVTSTQVIVDAIESLVDHNKSGIYNVGCLGGYTIKQMAESLGFKTTKVTQDYNLWESQGLHLINNVMSMDKLIKDTGHIPPDALLELRRCYDQLIQK